MPQHINPWAAADFTSFSSFAPNALAAQAFKPIPKPQDTAIIKFCSGKAMDTAVKASSLTLATYILSTILYKACISIEIIGGTDMEIKRGMTFFVPIAFSVFSISPTSSFYFRTLYRIAIERKFVNPHNLPLLCQTIKSTEIFTIFRRYCHGKRKEKCG